MNLDSSNCRLCLTSSENIINVFQVQSSKQTVASILNQHFWFEIKENDENKTICFSCWTKVENFHSFYTHVYDTHYEYFPKVKVEIVDENNPNQNGSPKFEHVQEEPSQDDDMHDDDIDLQSESSNKDEENDELEINVKKKAKPKTCKKTIKKTRTRKVKHSIEDQDKVESEDQQIREYFKMKCEICSVELDKFQNVQTHYRDEHNLRGYLKCCNKKYTERSLLVEHIQSHIDPNAFKCETCKKVYNDKRGLDRHMKRHKSTDERPFKCNECLKTFKRKYSLIRHTDIHKNEEKKFICDDCGKPYRTKDLLQSHKKNIHEGAFIHICDICARVFRSKLVFEQHHQTVHEKKIIPKVKCPICGVFVSDKYYLKKHMNRHGESKVFCNICGNQYLNRTTLLKHIRSVHTDKVYECTMCEKTFKKSISLKEHMATHTGEILYSCPYCPKTFNSSGNMYSHKKKHPKEYEEAEKMKEQGIKE